MGDTRHLSFLNLILSGYNPYTIAQLGGHRTLEAQMSYYSGATSYCTSKAFSLALGIKDLDINSSSIELYRKQQQLDISNAIELDNGYCVCSNFPYECESADCSTEGCQYFIHKNSDDIEKRILEVEEKISVQTQLLKLLIRKEPNDSAQRTQIIGMIKKYTEELSYLYKERKGDVL